MSVSSDVTKCGTVDCRVKEDSKIDYKFSKTMAVPKREYKKPCRTIEVKENYTILKGYGGPVEMREYKSNEGNRFVRLVKVDTEGNEIRYKP
jgi:hypothetical protein